MQQASEGQTGKPGSKPTAKDKIRQLRGTMQVEEAVNATPNVKTALTKEAQQPSGVRTRRRGGKPPANGKAQHPRDTSQANEDTLNDPNSEAAPAEAARFTLVQAQGAIPDGISGHGDGAERIPEEPQPDHIVINAPTMQDQETSPVRNDPSLAEAAMPGEESPTLESLLAGVGSLSPIVADEDLTDESYLQSTVLNSSELNFDRL